MPNWRLYGKRYYRYGYLLGMTGDQIQYATQASQNVFIVKPAAGREGRMVDVCMADILGMNYASLSDKFYLGFHEDQARFLMACFPGIAVRKCDIDAHVEFEVKHLYFDQLHRALDKIPPDCLARIIPEDKDFQEGLDLSRIPFPRYPFLKLDRDFQFKALQLATFSKSRAPVLIPGPFGTGKTRLLAVATHFFVHEARKTKCTARVLVCCHHQFSADTFVEQYFGWMREDKKFPWIVNLVRVTSQAYSCKTEFQQYYMEALEFKKWIQGRTTHPFFDHFVLVSTFMTSLHLTDVLGQNFFTHILIDEGAQAREPETIASLCLANPETKIIVAGDPQQVSNK